MPSKLPEDDVLISTREVARITGFSDSYFEKARVYGGGPKFIRFGRVIRYRRADVMAWIEQQAATTR